MLPSRDGQGVLLENELNSTSTTSSNYTEFCMLILQFKPRFMEMSKVPLVMSSLEQALNECNFEVMTEIQAKSIPHLLKGKDATCLGLTSIT